MAYEINGTHDPAIESWVDSANNPETDFPIQNLPFGVYKKPGGVESVGVAIGDDIFDISAAFGMELFDGEAAQAARRCGGTQVHTLMAMGKHHWSALRLQLSNILRHDSTVGAKAFSRAVDLLVPQADCVMSKPIYIGDFTDFSASLHHAVRTREIAGAGTVLPENYKWLPIGYHGRSSSIVISGTQIRRPRAQSRIAPENTPSYGKVAKLDFELEVGFLVGKGNKLGEPVTIEHADQHFFGACLLNDWSARDAQSWEVQPLGPFVSKSYATSMSPWIVTMEALAPYRTNATVRPAPDPQPLPYLSHPYDQSHGAIDAMLEAGLRSQSMRESGANADRICLTQLKELYWTPAQLLTHQTSNGCNLRYGDLIGTGTTSGAAATERACMLEITTDGAHPLTLSTGERRSYLVDGDEVILKGWCTREGYRKIGFGECRGIVIAT